MSIKIKWTDTQLDEAIKRHNAIAEGLAQAAPLVCALLDGARITGDQVGKRERDKIQAIIEDTMPAEPWSRCYLQTKYTYTLYLFADFSSHVREYGVAYAEMSVPVAQKNGDKWAACAPLTPAPVRKEDVQARIRAAIRADDAAQLAQSQAYEAKGKAYPFID